jgi:hypothetical protein
MGSHSAGPCEWTTNRALMLSGIFTVIAENRSGECRQPHRQVLKLCKFREFNFAIMLLALMMLDFLAAR